MIMKLKFSSIFTTSMLIKFFALLWIFSIAIFGLTIILVIIWFRADVQSTPFGNSIWFLILLMGSMCLGFLSFGLLILTIIIKIVLERKVLVFKKSLTGIFAFFFKLIFLLSLFPLYLIYRVANVGEFISRIKKERFKISFLKPRSFKLLIGRLVTVTIIILTFLPIWLIGYVTLGALTSQLISSELGYSAVTESIVGTGSMYPTFPKGNKLTPKEQYQETVANANFINYPSGIVIFGKRYFGRELKRGDIITFQNKKTEEETKKSVGVATGFLKRLIALPGDTLMLKSGILYLNSKPFKEPYIAKPRSTFAESFLSECTLIKIPKNKIFAMGDNRKGSGDSREIGFVDFTDIHEVLSIEDQKGIWDKNWRDTAKDFEETSKIKIDKEKYLQLLNAKRKEASVQLLKYQPKLEKSAGLRGETILKFDDFSWEATKSGYTMYKAMSDAGYSNITYGETPTQGYFEADELIDNQFQFPKTKEFLLNKDYQEIGIAEVEGMLNGCPAQVIVLHFAGYIPATYDKDIVDSWRSSVNNLNSIIPSWENTKGKGWMNEEELNSLLNLLYQERTIALRVLSKMDERQWLTKEDDNLISGYKRMSQESSNLANKLNQR